MKKLLIVDDQEEVQKLLAVVLRDDSLSLRHATSGDEALSLALADPPDLVLLDVMMPGGIDGLEVARRLRSDERTRHCRIVFLTAKVQEQDRRAAVEAGGDGFLGKPFKLDDVRALVRQFLPLPRA